MTPTVVGLIVGLFLGLALAFGGFGDMLIVAFFGALGYLIAKVLVGELDVTEYLGGRDRIR
jgi:hypothetical protein